MPLQHLAIQSQLIPPRPRKGILHRQRIRERLSAVLDAPLTLMMAGTGYGKSTALAELNDLVGRLFWYVVTEPDRDPLLFQVHLISAFFRHEEAYGEEALRLLEETGRPSPAVMTPLLNTLTSSLPEDAVLVIDDYHLVHDVPEIGALVRHLINYLPPRLHVVLSSRQMPDHLDLNRWRVKGQMATITHADLAFTASEIATLFDESFNHPLTPQQAERLAQDTEGWVLAVQMVWQSLQRTPAPSLEEVLDRLPDNLSALFDYLAPEVLARQPAELQDFLLATAVLRRLDGPACDALTDVGASRKILRRLHENGLFLESTGDESYRYQRQFQDFLLNRLQQFDPQRALALHRRAAGYLSAAGETEEAIYHLLAAGEFENAAEMIEAMGPELVRTGRLESLMNWIERLPAGLRARRPALELLLGDGLRLRADFDAALEHFSTAEKLYLQFDNVLGRARALRGQAQVYLDTIRPLKADSLLEEALRLLEPQEYRAEVAALLDQHAENKLNLGHPDQAQLLHREARLLRATTHPNDVYLEGRALLRTGRLAEARQLLEQQAAEERLSESLRPQRFHRETVLLLSLVCSMLGSGEEAERYSREGIEISRQLQSDFVEAVGFMRLGHALQVNSPSPWDGPRRQEALHDYQRSIEQVNPFKVARVGVEPQWGLCRIYGYNGDVISAEQKARSALEISEMAGDEWIGDLVRISMGASLAMAGNPAAARAWLERAAEGFRRVDDGCSWCCAMLWLSLNAWWQGDGTGALALLAQLAPQAREYQANFLFTRPTLPGLKDEQAVIPLLLEAYRQGVETVWVSTLLREMGINEHLEYHPGCTLWVRTLGPFGVWRGDAAVAAHDWQREKARQLFQLFIAQRGQWLLRDQIVDLMWPDLPMDAGVRDFKVALNALNRALEPTRPRSAQPFFIIRNENTYGLNPAARICVDADDFTTLSGAEMPLPQLRRALALYEDDFLPECRYEDWAAPHREHLRSHYLSASERLLAALVERRAWDEVIAISSQTLVRDNCWEPGYRSLMQAFAARGNFAQVQAAYNRCVTTLHDELGVEPSPETHSLLRRLTPPRTG